MEIEIISFGLITDIIGAEKLTLSAIDTDELRNILQEKFPVLLKTKYSFALQNIVIKENTILKKGDTVLLLPPFSGG